MKKQDKDKILKAMRDNLITSEEEAKRAIEFVSNLIEIETERLERDESYATVSIDELKEAGSRVRDLEDVIDDLDGESEDAEEDGE